MDDNIPVANIPVAHAARLQNLQCLKLAFDIFMQQNAVADFLVKIEQRADAMLKIKEADLKAAAIAAPTFVPAHLQAEVTALRAEIQTIRDYERRIVKITFETIRQVYNENCTDPLQRV